MLLKYFADIRDLTGREEERWSEPTPTLAALLRALSARFGVPFERRVLEGEKLSPTIIILVNGRHVAHLQGLETKLSPEDTVAVFPMVAGG